MIHVSVLQSLGSTMISSSRAPSSCTIVLNKGKCIARSLTCWVAIASLHRSVLRLMSFDAFMLSQPVHRSWHCVLLDPYYLLNSSLGCLLLSIVRIDALLHCGHFVAPLPLARKQRCEILHRPVLLPLFEMENSRRSVGCMTCVNDQMSH